MFSAPWNWIQMSGPILTLFLYIVFSSSSWFVDAFLPEIQDVPVHFSLLNLKNGINKNYVITSLSHPYTQLFNPVKNKKLRKPLSRNLLIFSNLSENNEFNDEFDSNCNQNQPPKIGGRRRVNQRVRDIMRLLNGRYDSLISSDGKILSSEWSKTRTYIYKATMESSKDPLSVRKVDEVLDFLDGKFGDLTPTIVKSCPRILRRNVQSQLLPTVEFLEELYGTFSHTVDEDCNRNDNMLYQALSRNPSLLLTRGVGLRPVSRQGEQLQSTEHDKNNLEVYLRNEIGLKDGQIEKIAQSFPTLFSYPVETRIQPSLEYLSSLLSQSTSSTKSVHNLNKSGIKKVILSSPRVLSLNLETNLKPKVEFLKKRCGFTSKHLAVLLNSCPGILGLSVTDNLEPFINYLESILKRGEKIYDENKIRDILQKSLSRHPQLLALSIENIQSKVDYFDFVDIKSEINPMGANSLARRIMISAPSVYSLSLEDNIMLTIQCLASFWGFSNPSQPPSRNIQSEMIEKLQVCDNFRKGKDSPISLSKRIAEYPTILTLSLEGNIQPTLSFYETTGYIDCTDKQTNKQPSSQELENNEHIIETSIDCPRNLNIRGRHIATSLYNRLLPRWHYFEERGNKDNSPPLYLLAVSSDKDFCKQFEFDEHHFQSFKKEKGPVLKFSSQFATWIKTGRPIDAL